MFFHFWGCSLGYDDSDMLCSWKKYCHSILGILGFLAVPMRQTEEAPSTQNAREIQLRTLGPNGECNVGLFCHWANSLEVAMPWPYEA
jgi:hypothetical protein